MSKARFSPLDEHADKLRDWFFIEQPKVTYATAQTRLAALNVRTSLGALCRWWARENSDRMVRGVLQNIATGAQLDKRLKAEFHRNPPPELETIVKLLQTIIAHLSIRGQEEPEILKIALAAIDRVLGYHAKLRDEVKLSQAGEQIAQEREKLDLLKLKAEQADAAKEVVASMLTPEEQRARLKEILK